MRPSCLLIRRFRPPARARIRSRSLLTLAIETSCDDTSVAVLERYTKSSAALLFNEKITSDNTLYGGVHPIVAHESHQKNLASLIDKAVQKLPYSGVTGSVEKDHPRHRIYLPKEHDEEELARKKPDFITVTRGPGMRANLITGIDTAKGLAVAWQIPLLGVNHMQAHALTPRLVSALNSIHSEPNQTHIHSRAFPFLTLLVSGGHTMLVHSKGLCDHEILANTTDIAVGDMIDKTTRDVVPAKLLKEAGGLMYGPLLEKFAFPQGEADYHYSQSTTKGMAELPTWSITHPLRNPTSSQVESYGSMFSFSGIGSSVKRIAASSPHMSDPERQLLAKETMRVAFEHLASRITLALKASQLSDLKTLVVSGGVASNQYLKHILRKALDAGGHGKMELLFPPPKFCTDNAAMIAWTGMEMWDAGYRTELDAMALKKWAIDPSAGDGGILSADGWKRVKLGKCGNRDPTTLV